MGEQIARPAALFVPLTGEWWEPTDDPERYRTVTPCDQTCHHPVHAFGHPERLRHTEDADWIIRNAAAPGTPPDAPAP